jgi:hypothetical protein
MQTPQIGEKDQTKAVAIAEALDRLKFVDPE